MELSVYTEVWTVIAYGDQSIDVIYTDKNEAEIACEEANKRIKKFKFMSKKYEVKTLYDAIDYIIDAVKDDIRYPTE